MLMAHAPASGPSNPPTGHSVLPQESQVSCTQERANIPNLTSRLQSSNFTVPESEAESSTNHDTNTATTLSSAPPPTAQSSHPSHCHSPTHLGLSSLSPSATSAPALDEEAVALAGLKDAEEILQNRHALIESQANGESKRSKVTYPLAGILKKPTVKAQTPVAQNTTPSITSRGHTGAHSQTANEVIEAVQRRQRIMSMAYNAASGCHEAAGRLQDINNHFSAIENGSKPPNSNIVIGFGDMHFRASELGSFEHSWINRYNAFCLVNKLSQRRLLNVNDYECIIEHLFPAQDAHLLSSEHFELFLAAIGKEGGLTAMEVEGFSSLAVTPEELERGVHFTPATTDVRARAREASNIMIFEMPQRRRVGRSSSHQPHTSSRDNLHWYLRVLVEAAVYDQKYYKGFLLPNAVQKLEQFYKAYKLGQEDIAVPAHLADYIRRWTYTEGRLLERGHLVCQMLKEYESGAITDFGIIRAVRGTLVHIDGQPRHTTSSIETFLYHRLPSAGKFPVAKIPEILSLLPAHDDTFSNHLMGENLLSKMEETARMFQVEELARLCEIRDSQKAYKLATNKKLGVWGRVQRKAGVVKHKLGGAFGLRKKAAGTSFDPFAPEHGNTVADDQVDGSFYG